MKGDNDERRSQVVLPLLLLALLSCTTSRSSEQHLEATAELNKKAASQEEEHVRKEEGPWLELDFAQPAQEAAVGPQGQPVQESNDGLGEGADPQTAREDGHTPGIAVPNDIRQRGAFGVVQPPAKLDASHADGLPPHGALIKAVFHGPSTEELVRIAKMQETEHGTLREQGSLETHAKTRWGPPWWVWAGLALAVPIAAYAAWKTKPPFLGFLWRLLP